MRLLLEHVLEEGRSEARRVFDRGVNEARRLVQEAESRVEDLTRAARDLGRVRGAAAETAVSREAEEEASRVRAAAQDALFERFLVRVRGALEGIAQEARYPAALAAFAARVAVEQRGDSQGGRPVDVFCAPKDRPRVFDALLQAQVSDFRVSGDARIHVGFVAKDLDGRTVLDATPAALVERFREELRTLLQSSAAVREAPPT